MKKKRILVFLSVSLMFLLFLDLSSAFSFSDIFKKITGRFAYEEGICTCSSCSDCQDALNNASCQEVKLSEDISQANCISLVSRDKAYAKTFDCDNYKICGIKFNFAKSSLNLAIKNCVFSACNYPVVDLVAYNITGTISIQDSTFENNGYNPVHAVFYDNKKNFNFILDNNIIKNNKDGVNIVDYENSTITISNNQIYENAYSGISVISSSFGDISFLDNEIKDNKIYGIFSTGGNVNLERNRVCYNCFPGQNPYHEDIYLNAKSVKASGNSCNKTYHPYIKTEVCEYKCDDCEPQCEDKCGVCDGCGGICSCPVGETCNSMKECVGSDNQPLINSNCTPFWNCTNWSCIDGEEARICRDLNSCEEDRDETRTCLNLAEIDNIDDTETEDEFSESEDDSGEEEAEQEFQQEADEENQQQAKTETKIDPKSLWLIAVIVFGFLTVVTLLRLIEEILD